MKQVSKKPKKKGLDAKTVIDLAIKAVIALAALITAVKS